MTQAAHAQVRPFKLPKEAWIALFALGGIGHHLILRFLVHSSPASAQAPLLAVLVFGGVPLLADLGKKILQKDVGSDLLAGISIVASLLMREYLAGAIVVLMLAGGAALEEYAVQRASSVLRALAKRMPSIAHRKRGSEVADVDLNAVAVGDLLVVFPHEICPVDGLIVDGHSTMDESFLTGEPFHLAKAPGSRVISGAVNGETALVIRAEKLAVDSRYAKITEVMRAAEHNRPRMRRLADRLGAFYVPLTLAVAAAAWIFGGDPRRFLAVLVVATPCPLIIGIPIAIIGAIALCAKRSIIVKNPAMLEQIDACETAIFDKTGTLTYGEPRLAELLCAPGFERKEVLALVASVERYSRHPLAQAITAAASAEHSALQEAAAISETPGEGLQGVVGGRAVRVVNREKLLSLPIAGIEHAPPASGGMECMAAIDDRFAALLRFRDEPRTEGFSFIQHLGPNHKLQRVLIVSGDRESEVRYLADRVGITEVHAGKSPEEKLEIVREETKRSKTLFVGDGINDAPALMAATVGIAVGQNSDITSEAAGVVVMDNSLVKIDEFMHISRRMRAIALQSAVGGMVLSIGGMAFAAAGLLPPVAGAVCQEIIDLLAVLNALRAALPPRELSDF